MRYNQNDHLNVDRVSVLMQNVIAGKKSWDRIASVRLMYQTALKHIKAKFDPLDDLESKFEQWGEVIGEAVGFKYVDPNTIKMDSNDDPKLILQVENNTQSIDKVRVILFAVRKDDDARIELCRFKFEVEPSIDNFSAFAVLIRGQHKHQGPII